MKNKVLIIFKYPRDHWNTPIINKFSNYYDTEYLYISNYKNKSYKKALNREDGKSTIVVEHGDYYYKKF